jgi:hypothetical protein
MPYVFCGFPMLACMQQCKGRLALLHGFDQWGHFYELGASAQYTVDHLTEMLFTGAFGSLPVCRIASGE